MNCAFPSASPLSARPRRFPPIRCRRPAWCWDRHRHFSHNPFAGDAAVLPVAYGGAPLPQSFAASTALNINLALDAGYNLDLTQRFDNYDALQSPLLDQPVSWAWPMAAVMPALTYDARARSAPASGRSAQERPAGQFHLRSHPGHARFAADLGQWRAALASGRRVLGFQRLGRPQSQRHRQQPERPAAWLQSAGRLRSRRHHRRASMSRRI